jgi:tRNA-splicing ligase RtcB
MADSHVGYVAPIGSVAAYRNQVSLMGVGVDIGCGNNAVLTNLKGSDFDERDWKEKATEINRTISFGVGRRNDEDDAPTDHQLFDSYAWSLLPTAANIQNFKGKARKQLGTVGGGNHYVDVFTDNADRIWIGTHFGSRGFGHGVAMGFLALSQNQPWDAKVKEIDALFDLDSEIGHAYWELMRLAGQYAHVGRQWVCEKVTQILGGTVLDSVANNHNFAWKEFHFNEELIVVRKGATPAFPNQRGFVGGSMGDISVILEGRSNASTSTLIDQVNSMFSTVHGAGRVMSRKQAKGKTKGWGRKAKLIAPGLISQQMMDDWVNGAGVVRRGGDLDEAPQAYRRLPEVLTAQGETINILEVLTPRIVCMAPADTHDPFKD